jgi:hypothetical protein
MSNHGYQEVGGTVSSWAAAAAVNTENTVAFNPGSADSEKIVVLVNNPSTASGIEVGLQYAETDGFGATRYYDVYESGGRKTVTIPLGQSGAVIFDGGDFGQGGRVRLRNTVIAEAGGFLVTTSIKTG